MNENTEKLSNNFFDNLSKSEAEGEVIKYAYKE